MTMPLSAMVFFLQARTCYYQLTNQILSLFVHLL